MQITIALWSSQRELASQFIEATTKHTGLTFSTAAQGGFTDASFNIQVSGWNAVRWYRSYLGFHVVIFDHFGRRLYEGRIEDTEASSDGVHVTCLGYYSHANELTHGMVYPAGDTVTPTDIIKDTVDIAYNTKGLWANDYSMICQLSHNIAPQDFTGSKKLSDAIDVATKFGDDGIVPRPVYFAIWDFRRAYFYVEPLVTGAPTWRAFTKDFSSSTGLSLSRTRSEVWNKIQVTYDDPDIGAAFTDWAINADSQRLFGIREGTLNIGSALPAVAEVIRDLAINSYAFPSQASSIGITGRVYNSAGAMDYPYMVRAGQTIQVADYDPSVAQMVGGSTGLDSSTAFITRTSYEADSNELTVELGRKSVALDLLMARLGMGSGRVS